MIKKDLDTTEFIHLAVSPEIVVFDGSKASQIPGSCDWRQTNGHSWAQICEVWGKFKFTCF